MSLFKKDLFVEVFRTISNIAGIVGLPWFGVGIYWWVSGSGPLHAIIGFSLILSAGASATLLAIHDHVEAIRNR